ncbi:hypothetical protein [Phaeobacter sp. 11ANDIMAR09]|uniref:hypothetical protein n=1 Tax=Phaeobacter sp. 11ANDIMAR09 TaxID=1225647 RepID=UPI0006C8620D|nr:hypothetical protein [Phaeobacter sp. 11ANDIMAR09]KPD13481.1 hypothetical protein AN476_04625 [Phaeobacter sp. 11ANDIMAR09]
MTEKTANSRNLLFPAAKAKRHLVDPVAFGLAMVGGPLLTGILGAPALLIPTIATVFGGPIYLLVGVPVMLVALRRQPLAPGGWALLALATHLSLFTPLFLPAWLTRGSLDGPGLFLVFGSAFAPLWGAVSGLIYHRLERRFFKQTI